MIGNILGLAAGALAVVIGVLYLRLDPDERPARGPVSFLVAMAVAMGLGVLALSFPIGPFGRVSAWLAVVASGIFIGLRLRSE